MNKKLGFSLLGGAHWWGTRDHNFHKGSTKGDFMKNLDEIQAGNSGLFKGGVKGCINGLYRIFGGRFWVYKIMKALALPEQRLKALRGFQDHISASVKDFMVSRCC